MSKKSLAARLLTRAFRTEKTDPIRKPTAKPPGAIGGRIEELEDRSVPAVLSIDDVTLAEGNSGTVNAMFTVSLDVPAPVGGVTFDIATADDSAIAPDDYTAQSLTSQIIPEGQTTYTFTVTILSDEVVEPNETFFVNVTAVSGATVGDGQGLGTITNDDTAPSVTTVIASPAAISDATVGTGTFAIAVTFDRPMDTGTTPAIAFSPTTTSTLTFASGAWSNSDQTYTATYDVADANVDTPGVIVSVAGAKDVAGNTQTAFASGAGVFSIDTLNPTVSVTTTAPSPTNTTPIPFTITFSESVADFDEFDITVTNGSVTAFSGTGTTYTVSVTPVGQGAVTVSVAPGQAHDAATNPNVASNTLSVVYDSVAPAAPVITSPANNSYQTTATPTVSGTAEAGATVKVYDGVTLVGTTTANGAGNWSVATSTLAEGGHTLTATATDAANNTSAASTAVTITVDTIAPAVTTAVFDDALINDADVTLTRTLTVTFSEAMNPTFVPTVAVSAATTLTNPTNGRWATGNTQYLIDYTVADANVTLADVTVDVSGARDVAGNTMAAVVGRSSGTSVDTQTPAAPVITSPATNSYQTTATPTVSGTAEAGATVKVYDGVTLVGTTTANGAGNWSVATSTLAEGGHTLTATATDTALNTSAASTAVTITVDTIAPTVTSVARFSPAAALTNGTSVTFRVVFDEAVANVGAADFVATGTATGWAVSGATGSGTTYDVTVTYGGGTRDGTVGLGFAAGQDITDLAGNALANTTPGTSQTYTSDATAPTVTAVTPSVSTVNDNTATFTLTVTYSEPMDTLVNPTVTLSPSVASTLTSPSGSWTNSTTFVVTYTVVDVGVDVPAVGVSVAGAKDLAGNTQTAYTSPGGVFSIDTLNPTVSVTTTAPSPTNTSPIPVTITFSESVADFDTSDITVTNGSVTAFSGSGTTYTVSVTPGGQGAVTVSVAQGKAHDAATNPNVASNTLSVVYDSVAPTVSSVTVSPAALRIGQTATVTIVFSEAINPATFTTADLSAANGTLSGLTTTNNVTWTATLTPTANVEDATNVVAVVAGGYADPAGNAGGAGTSNNYAIDTRAPTATVAPAATPTTATAAVFTVTFSESVTTLTAAMLAATITNGTVGTPSVSGPSGNVYTVTVPVTSGYGTVSLSLAADQVFDAAGNGNVASNTGTILFKPLVTLSVTGGPATEAGATVLTVTATSTVPVAANQTVTVGQTAGTAAAADYALSGTTITIATGQSSGSVTFTIVNDAILEATETATLTISAPSVGLALGGTVSQGVSITDDETASLAIETTSTVAEGGGNPQSAGRVTLTITGTQSGSATYTLGDGLTIVGKVVAGSGTAVVSGGGGDVEDPGQQSVTFTSSGASIAQSGDSQTVGLTINNDNRVEGSETALLSLSLGVSSPAIAGRITLGNTANVTTITDNDTAVIRFVSASSSVTELNSGSAPSTIPVELVITASGGGPVGLDVAVTGSVTITGGTATSPSDYTGASPQTVTFNPGNGTTLAPVTQPSVSVVGDLVVEDNETVTFALAQTSGPATVGASSHTLTINNDDVAALSISAPTITETNADQVVTFTVTVDKAVQGGFSVAVSLALGDAEATDVILGTTTLTFVGNAGESQLVSVTIKGDTIVEADETFTVTLGAVTAPTPVQQAAITSGQSAVGTIVNDDSTTITISNAASTPENAGPIVFTVSSSNPVEGGFTLRANTANGAATAANDYIAVVNQLLTFTQANTPQTVSVALTNDNVVELDEAFTLGVGSLGGLALGVPSGKFTIVSPASATIADDDGPTSLSVAAASATEGTGIVFTATLTKALDTVLTVSLTPSIGGGTAEAGDLDFTVVTITIPAGQLTGTATVNTTADTIVERDETFTVTLGTPSAGGRNVVVGTASATGTIVDDDTATLAVNSVTLNEGDGGVTIFTFTVTLSALVEGGVSVAYATADGTAVEPGDYTGGSSSVSFGTLSTTAQTFTVGVKGDTLVEATEAFFANLGTVTPGDAAIPAAKFTTTNGVGTITNDDSAAFSIAAAAATEGGSVVFTITLSNPVDVATSVTVTTADLSAEAASDYTARSGFTVNIPANSTSQTVSVATSADAVVEANETFTATLGGLNAGGRSVTIGTAAATGTISNDDSATVSVNSVSVTEGGDLVFTVTLSAAVQGGVTVPFTVTNGTATTADADYSVVTVSPLTFVGTAGETQTITVSTGSDTKVERDETLTVTLGAPTGAAGVPGTPGGTLTVAGSPGTGTVLNNDSTTLTIVGESKAENGGPITFTVQSSNAVDGGFTVGYTTADGTAVDGSDYALAAGSLGFAGAAGETKTFAVTLVNDNTVEGTETFLGRVTGVSGQLSGIPAGNFVLPADATGTITNDDSATVSISTGGTLAESANRTFTITLSNPVDTTVTVRFDTTTGTATAGSDYTAVTNQTVTFNPLVTTQVVTVTVADDARLESDETLPAAIGTLTTSYSGSVTLGTTAATGTISDNETATVSFGAAASSVLEGNVVVTIPVALALAVSPGSTGTAGLDRNVVARITDAGSGTAVNAAPPTGDFTFTTTDVTFAAGSNGTSFPGAPLVQVAVAEDFNTEGDETVVLSGVVLAANGTATTTAAPTQHTLTILDDDAVRTYDATIAGNYTLKANGTNLELYRDATLVTSGPIAGAALVINGVNGSTDTLTIDFSTGNPIPVAGVTWNGGTAGNDRLTTTGGMFASATHTFTSPNSGTIQYAGSGLITYTGLEPVDESGMVVPVRVFVLPAGPSDVVLEDDGTAGNGVSQVRSANGTFETTKFANPATSLTITRGNAADTVTVTAVPDFTAALTLGTPAAPFASVSVTGAVSLAAGKALSVVAGSFANTAAITTLDGGPITLTADDVEIGGTIAVTGSPGAVIWVKPLTANRPIDLGTETAGKLSLKASEMAYFTAGLRLGDTAGVGGTPAGPILVTDFIDFGPLSGPGSRGLSLLSAGAVTNELPGDGIQVRGLYVTAASFDFSTSTSASVGFIGGNTAGAFRLRSFSPNFLFVDGGDLVTGITAGGAVELTNTEPGLNGVIRTILNGITSGGNPVTLTADELQVVSPINAGAALVTILPFTAGRPIDLGTNSAGTLNLSAGEFASITAGSFQIGSAAAGALTVSAPISPTASNGLGLTSGSVINVNGTVTVAGTTTINAPTVNLNANVVNAVTGTTATTVSVAAPGQIQDGINVAVNGATVTVGAGTYTENVALAKQLTLRGAQFGVDARGRVATETIVSSTATAGTRTLLLVTGAAGSVIDGFTFSGGFRGIESTTGPLNNLQLLNNRVVGITNNGVFLNDPGTDITVSQNVFDGSSNATATSGYFHLDTDTFNGFYFTNNWVLNTPATEGFFVDGNHNVGPSGIRTPLISGNLFHNNNVGANLGRFAFGSLSTLNAGTISNNTFSNNTFDGLQGGMQHVLITQNTFSGNGRSGLALTGFSGSVSGDSTRGAQNTTVTQNVFSGNSTQDLSFSATQFPGTISTNIVFGNSFGSTTAVAYGGTETIQASGNWWGAATNPEFAPVKIVGAGAAKVDYSPWLNSGTDTDLGTPGFQGSFASLSVDDDSAFSSLAYGGVTPVASRYITEAYDLLVSPGTIQVRSGTYTEALDLGAGVNKAVTLAPGNSPGQVLVNGNLTLTSNDTLAIEIGGTSAATGYDNLVVVGTVTLGGATLTVAQFGGFTVTPSPLESYTIIDNDGSDLVSGSFLNLPEGTPISYAGGTVYISYTGGDGNDVVLYSQPVINGTPGADTFVLRQVSGSPGVFEISVNAAPFVNLGAVNVVTVNGLAGNDSLTIDYVNGTAMPAGGVAYNGGTETDVLVVTRSGGAFTATTVTHTFTSASAGSVDVDGRAVTYTSLETPTTDGLTAANRVFTFNGGPETVTVSDPTAADGFTRVASTAGLAVDFRNPTAALTINAGTGDDTVTVSALETGYVAALTIHGDGGTDTVNLNAAITYAAGNSLTVTAETISVTAVQTLSGAGAVSLTAGQSVAISANVTGGTGGVSVSGAGTAALNTTGVTVSSGAVITAGGAGAVSVTGTGGGGAGTGNIGVLVTGAGSRVTSAGGTVAVSGTGGAGGAGSNHGVLVDAGGQITAGGAGTVGVTGNGAIGVYVSAANSMIASSGGAVTVVGTGAAGGAATRYGVAVDNQGRITAGGTAALSVTGTGGSAATDNRGVYVFGTNSAITAAGPVTVSGTGGAAGTANPGVTVESAGTVSSTGSTLSVTGTAGAATSTGLSVAAGTTLTAAGLATLTGPAGSDIFVLSGATVNFGSLTFTSTGIVSITEDSQTDLAGASTAGTLSLTATGLLTNLDGSSLAVSGNAALAAGSVNLGTQTTDTINFGSLTFVVTGAVTIREDSSTLLTNTSQSSALTLASTAGITNTAGAVLTVTGLADFTGTSVVLGNQTGDAMNFGSLTVSSTGAVDVREDSDMAVNTVSGTTINLTSTGAISDNNAGAVNVIGTSLTAAAAAGIDLDTTIGTLTAATVSGTGSISVRDTAGGLAVTLATTANGSITLTAAGGDLTLTTVTAAGGGVTGTTTTSGNILVDAVTATTSVALTAAGAINESGSDGTSDIVANSATLSAVGGIGNLGTLEIDLVTLTSASTTGTNAPIDLADTAGGLVVTSATTTDGAIALSAASLTLTTVTAGGSGRNVTAIATAGGIAVGAVSAAGDTVTLSATGAITDANAGAVNVVADVLSASAGTGIDLDTTITTLSSATVSGTGSISVRDTAGGLAVTLATTANGSITLTAAGGDLTLSTVTAAGGSVTGTTTGSGNILVDAVTATTSVLLTAAGAINESGSDGTADIVANSATLSAVGGIGNLGTLEVDLVTLTSASTTGTNAPIDLADTAGGLVVTSATTTDGAITLSAASLTLTTVTAGGNGRDVTATAGGIAVGAVSAAGDTVTLSATGAITDANGGALNFTAQNLALSATAGIGSADALETDASNVAFQNTTSGAVRLTELVGTSGFVVASVGSLTTSFSTNGAVVLVANSPITFAVNTSGTSVTAQAVESALTNFDNVTVNAGVTVSATAGDLTFEAGDRIIIAATGSVTASGNVIFRSGFGDTDDDGSMALDGSITAATGTVTLDLNAEAGSATQAATGTITAATLSLLGVGGSGAFVLDASTTNNVGTLTVNAGGKVNYTDANGLVVGTVTTTNDDVTLAADLGNVSLTGNVALGTGTLRIQTNSATSGVSQTGGTIAAATLGLRTGSGGISLPNSANNVDTIAATTTGAFLYRDADGFSIGTVTADGDFTPAVTGITAAGSLTFCVGGPLSIDAPINAAGQTVRIKATSVSQAAAGTITAAALGIEAGGAIALTAATNDVDTIAFRTTSTGNIGFANAGGLTIGSVTVGSSCITSDIFGVTAADGSVTLSNVTSGNVVLAEAVSAAANAVSISNSAGAIVDDASDTVTDITAGALTLSALSGIGSPTGGSLDTNVTSVTAAVTAAGAIDLNEANAVTLTSVTTANGPITILAGGSVVATSVVSSTDTDANDISITATSGDITVATITGGAGVNADVTLTAAGSILDDGNDSTVITADVLTLTATAGSVGAAGALPDLDTTAVSITAAGATGVWITETNGVTLTSVTTTDGPVVVAAGGLMTATLVTANGSGRNVTLTTTAGGIAVGVVTAAGDTVTLTAAGAITDGNGAAVNVVADVLAASAATGIDLDTTVTTVSSATVSGTGAIDISDTAGGLVVTLATTNDGSIALTAAGGDLSLVSVTAGGNGDVTASTTGSGNVGLGLVTAVGNTVTLTAAGAITDADTTANDIDAQSAALTAATGIGSAANPIELTVTTLAATTGTGGVFATDLAGGLIVGTVGSVIGVSVSGLSGNIAVTAASPLTVNAPVTGPGTIDLTAGNSAAAGDDLTVNANVTSSGGGTITLTAGDSILHTAGTVGTSGTVRYRADNEGDGSGAVTQSAGTALSAADVVFRSAGAVSYTAGTNDVATLAAAVTNAAAAFEYFDQTGLTVGTVDGLSGVTTNGGNVELRAVTGSLSLAQSIAAGAGTVRLQADAGGVSESGAATVTAGALGVRAGSGNVALNNSNDADTFAAFASGSVGFLNGNGVTIGTVTAGVGFVATTGVTTTNGTVTVTNNTSGDLTVAQAVSAGGASAVVLDANGATGDLVVNAAVSSAGGSITLTADDDVAFSAAGDVTSNNGNVVVTGNADASGGGAVTMDQDTSVNAGSGTIAVSAAGNVTLGDLTTTNATALAVTVTSTAGSILDAGTDADAEITADAAGAVVTLTANAGAIGGSGAANTIETTVATLVASSANGIWVTDSTGLTVTSATTTNGTIELQAGGAMTATLVSAGGMPSDVRLTTTAGGIAVGSVSALGDGVLIDAAGSVTDLNAPAVNVSALRLLVRAAGGIDLDTAVSTLAAVNTSGAIDIANDGSLTIDDVTLFGVTVVGVTNTAAGSTTTTITAATAGSNALLLVNDPVAGRGTVTLSSDQNLTLDAAVSSISGAVLLNADLAADAGVGAGVIVNAAVSGVGVTITTGNDPDTVTVTLAGSVAAGAGAALIQTAGGSDTVTISGPVTGVTATVLTGAAADAVTVNATGLSQLLTVDGGDAGDTFTVNASPTLQLGTVAIADTGTGGTDALTVNGTGGVETFDMNNAAAGARNILVGGASAARVTYTPALERATLAGGAGGDTYNIDFAQGAGSSLPSEWTRIDAGAGADTANLSGTTTTDTMSINVLGALDRVTSSSGAAPGGENVDYTGLLEVLNVYGRDEAGQPGDTFSVRPDDLTAIKVFGGTPTVYPGDTLEVDLVGLVTLNPTFSDPALPNGTLSLTGYPTPALAWDGIENFPVPRGLGGSFDFGPAGAPVQFGFTGVLPSRSYPAAATEGTGWHGWATTPQYGNLAYNETNLSPDLAASPVVNLLRDYEYGFQTALDVGVFRVDVAPNKPVQLTAILGTPGAGRDGQVVEWGVANTPTGLPTAWTAITPVNGTFTIAGEMTSVSAILTAANIGNNQSLFVRFRDITGEPYWSVSALDVRPTNPAPGMGNLLPGGLVAPLPVRREFSTDGTAGLPGAYANQQAFAAVLADGATIDYYRGKDAIPNSVVTVTATNGTPVDALFTAGDTALGTRVLNADAASYFQSFQVQADANGEFTFGVRRPTGTAPSTVTVADATGFRAGAFTQAFALPTTRRIDFGPLPGVTTTDYGNGGTVGAGYTPFAAAAYTSTAANALGWAAAAPTPLPFTPGGTGVTAAQADGVYGGYAPSEFVMDMPTGSYVVTATLGDASARRDDVFVEVFNGTTWVFAKGFNPATGAYDLDLTGLTSPAGVSPNAGQSMVRTFLLPTTGNSGGVGQLRVRFGNVTGNPYWSLSAIDVRPAQASLAVTAPGGTLPANGMTASNFTVNTAAVPNGTLLTVRVGAGQVAGTDQNSTYDGFQILSTGASTTISVVAPSSATAITSFLEVETLGGEARGAASQAYSGVTAAPAGIQRFDFNGPTNTLATGLTAVRGNLLQSTSGAPVPAYPSNPVNVNYGWTFPVGEFDRDPSTLPASMTADQKALFQDGVSLNATKATFRVKVDPGQYGVRYYIGDSSKKWPWIQIQVEGQNNTPAASTGQLKTTLNQYWSYVLQGSDTSGDGYLDISIFGANVWVLNGLDVAAGGIASLPPSLFAPSPQRAAFQVTSGTAAKLTRAELAPVVAEAVQRWAAAGADPARLMGVTVSITDLNDVGRLGEHVPGSVHIDDDAGGRGWFVDPTPADDAEFGAAVAVGLGATDRAAAKGVDLLTVVMHELGHELGLDDVDPAAAPADLMAETLDVGVRRLPAGLSASLPAATVELPARPTVAATADAVTMTLPAPALWMDKAETVYSPGVPVVATDDRVKVTAVAPVVARAEPGRVALPPVFSTTAAWLDADALLHLDGVYVG